MDAGSDSIPVAADQAAHSHPDERAAKRLRIDDAPVDPANHDSNTVEQYLIIRNADPTASTVVDDDAAESRGAEAQPRPDDRDSGSKKKGGKKKAKGQNTERSFGKFEDALPLCNSRAHSAEFSPRECRFGDACRMCHDLRKYLKEGRREDVETLGGVCPVFEQYGHCPSGWKCRFVKSHMREVEHGDGRTELVLISNRPSKAEQPAAPEAGAGQDCENGGEANEIEKENDSETGGQKEQEKKKEEDPFAKDEADERPGVYNVITMGQKIALNRRRMDFSRADQYIKWLNKETEINQDVHHRRKDHQGPEESVEDRRARFVDPPFRPSEKRRLYFGPETPTLAPLTTQGNLPFRRLCVELGCQLTYSEMALGMPLLNGTKADWTLLKAHESEIAPPRIRPGAVPVFDDYDHARDLRFGAQIAGSAPWVVTKAADVLTRYCPHLRLIDLNCGCPIDMVFKSGAGSALLDAAGKLERMVRGMNAVSGEIPITVKLRTGVRSARPQAAQLVSRLAFGSREHRERLGAPGCAAVTLHGRSREQRYTKTADWAYIAECAALVRSYHDSRDALADTAADPDPRDLPNAPDGGRMYFLGNGDCYSHADYYDNLERSRVDAVMIGRGALIKPWIFEEIEKGQYLDKSASERLRYVEKFARYGLEAWGSDELGIGFTRRFLLEWLSFAHRYVPIGILEHLPPRINDRPPAYRGRDDLETLLASDNYKDWIKITEMFLGPVHPGFQFQPKHKSNAYETEG
ncbi:tRNA-dihydrouridine(47) synthase [Escovopsis weberi]|uniref:tRNA-dihydrouridine(47) synthase [NAD(P)(+)] n=1 Tax=Escovopsis weberi TaxID=150374 RepID=A0A0M8MYR5_ESCWE|nr:tRNA-dihydrouridine(47) synthase [Escovopsis weberi]